MLENPKPFAAIQFHCNLLIQTEKFLNISRVEVKVVMEINSWRGKAAVKSFWELSRLIKLNRKVPQNFLQNLNFYREKVNIFKTTLNAKVFHESSFNRRRTELASLISCIFEIEATRMFISCILVRILSLMNSLQLLLWENDRDNFNFCSISFCQGSKCSFNAQ